MQPIRTALLSYGMSGWVFHAPFIEVHPGFELYAVLERTKNLAAAKHPGIKTYRTTEALLNDDLVELVVVNTPNYTHYEYAKQALNADKHVIVEKPFTITSEQAAELIELAEKANRKLSVFQNRRWDSDFKTVQQLLHDQLLGKVVEAEIHFDRYKEELSPKLHKETPGPGTGILYDLGSHLIDQALILFGMPSAVFADLAAFRPASAVDDYMEVILYYSSLRVRIKGSYITREPVPAYIIHGSKGSLLKPRGDIQELMLQEGKKPGSPDWGSEPEEAQGLLHTEINGNTVRKHIPSHKGNYLEYYDQLYKAIKEDLPPPVTAQQGRQVIHIIEKAFESNDQKKVVQL